MGSQLCLKALIMKSQNHQWEDILRFQHKISTLAHNLSTSYGLETDVLHQKHLNGTSSSYTEPVPIELENGGSNGEGLDNTSEI
ncbi:hypothetical protein J1N35_029267 [Gossypium stocksii]|uniref:Uncharacterized protein n=1 Tax=Gossypium stocksii TaxID=47602 RepID=A0A9D3UXY3_9ROSI|nr:hypothetical protein J1N35_029267 [Gossypium stocksii]